MSDLTSAQKRALPRARLISFRWVWPFNGQWFLKTRGANFAALWLGPLNIAWRMPWLPHSARALHPQLSRDILKQSEQSQ